MNYPVTNDSGHQKAQSQKNLVNSLVLFKLPVATRNAHTSHLLLFKALKERFYEAGIRISEPESAETKAEMR